MEIVHTFTTVELITFYDRASTNTTPHRRPEGGGATLGSSPLEFENDDVICCFRAKYPKIFARAVDARIDHP